MMENKNSKPVQPSPVKEIDISKLSHKSLFEQFKNETGLSEEEIRFRTLPGKDMPSRDFKLFYEEDGNIVIPYFTISGQPVQFPKKNKLVDFQRIRLKDPLPTGGKYKQPKSSGTFPYFTPGVIKKYRLGEVIPDLFIIEGEKKALAGWKKLNLDFVAIGGIHSTKDTELCNELHQDIQELIRKCHTKRIILFFDADAVTCNYDIDNPTKDLYLRALSFFSSITKFKELCAPFNLDLYFCHIHPRFIYQAKGLDDLLLLQTTNPEDVCSELKNLATGEKIYTGWFNLSGSSDSKLKTYLGLDSAEIFYSKNHIILKDSVFRFKNRDYQHNGNILKQLQPKIGNEVFWSAIKHADGSYKGCRIDCYRLIQFLIDNGFRRFDINQDCTFLKITDNRIGETTATQIQDFVINYIKSLSSETLNEEVSITDLLSKLYTSPQHYFSKSKLSLIENETIDINQDKLDTSFIYYKNCFVEVTAHQILDKQYKELPTNIYQSQEQQRTFQKGSEECNFKTFVYNVSGKDHENFLSLRSIMGYLLHDYYDYKRRAINLTDSRISDADEGRTGKTLLIRAIGMLKKYTEISGKTFDITNKHRYQEASFDTQIIHINDTRRNFRLENIFNDITDGILVDKKNQQPFTINAKIAVSSNKPLRVEGASARDRIIEFELADHYSDIYSPEDEFNEWFFRDWDTESWHAFDNFMINCIQLFLDKGILEPKQTNIQERKLREETHVDFVEFMDESLSNISLNEQKFNKKELHHKFLTEFEEHRNDKFLQKQSIFTKYLKKYASYRGLSFQEFKSGSERSIIFSTGCIADDNTSTKNEENDNSEVELHDLPF